MEKAQEIKIIKEIEAFVASKTTNFECDINGCDAMNLYAVGLEKLELALEVIRGLQAQVDRVRDAQKLKNIINGVKSLCDYEHVLDYLEIIKQLQNYILGGEGV